MWTSRTAAEAGRRGGGERSRRQRERTLKALEAGDVSGIARRRIRRTLIEERIPPYQCAGCGLDPEWQGEELVLQLDHKDGNRQNARPENLRFLCPNCYSQTPTFARNKTGL